MAYAQKLVINTTTGAQTLVDLTPEEIAARDAERATAEAEDTQKTNDDNALRNVIIPLAQSAVGIRLDQLTAAQVRALFAITLWRQGALNPDGTVRPLNQWVK